MRIRRNSLRTRTAMAMAVTVGFALFIQLGLLFWSARLYLRTDLERRARDYALLSTPGFCTSYEAYHDSGRAKLEQQAAQLLNRSEDVVSVLVVEVAGQILFDANKSSSGGVPGPVPSLEAWHLAAVSGLELKSRHVTNAAGEWELELASPYLEEWGRHRLTVIYRFSYDKLRARISAALALLGGNAAVAIVFSFVVGALMARRVSRPLVQLTSRVQDVAEGRFAGRVEVPENAPDELRILSQTFNGMAQELDRQVQSLAASNAGLQAANLELAAKNTELDRFTYTVSHDLKSPLVTIRAYTSHMLKDAAAGRLERLSADGTRILDATDKMRQLLDGLLELSRVGRVATPIEPVALGTLAAEAAELLKGVLQQRRVPVEITLDHTVVRGDRQRLLQVFQNLIDNASKFMGQQPEPRVEVGMREAGGERVFFVRDNGAGILAEHHDRVFGLFDKLDPQSEGTGVGLALVRRIVEVHGGRIWVESEGEGRGATLCFTLGD